MTITPIGGQVKGHRDLTVIIIKWDARARVSVFERMRFSHMSQKNEKYLDSFIHLRNPLGRSFKGKTMSHISCINT